MIPQDLRFKMSFERQEERRIEPVIPQDLRFKMSSERQEERGIEP